MNQSQKLSLERGKIPHEEGGLQSNSLGWYD